MQTTTHLQTFAYSSLFQDVAAEPSIQRQDTGRSIIQHMDAFWGMDVFNRDMGQRMILAMDRLWGAEINIKSPWAN